MHEHEHEHEHEREHEQEWLQERPQRPHIFHVFLELFALRRFQHLRDLAKAAVAHDETERFQSDLPFPDMFVPITREPRAAFESFRCSATRCSSPMTRSNSANVRFVNLSVASS